MNSQTPPVTNIELLFDSQLDDMTVRQVASAVLTSYSNRETNVEARVIDQTGYDVWKASLPFMSEENHPSLTSILKEANERARNANTAGRLEGAIDELASYFQVHKVAEPCIRVLPLSEEIASVQGEFTAVLVLSGTLCDGARVHFKPHSERTVVALMAPSPGGSANADCQQLAHESQVKAWFPEAIVVPLSMASNLPEIVTGRQAGVNPPVWRGYCSTRVPAKHHPQAIIQTIATPPSDSTLPPTQPIRLILPKQFARVGRELPFEGDGADPGERLCPVVQVADEYWANECVYAQPDGSFSGSVVIGRPSTDCGVLYSLRILRGAVDIQAGRATGILPQATGSSLPVNVIRATGCS